MKMFCKHDWKILSEKTTQSQFEHALSQIQKAATGSITVPRQMCDASRKFIQIVTCTKCGKLKRFVENI